MKKFTHNKKTVISTNYAAQTGWLPVENKIGPKHEPAQYSTLN